MREMSNGITRGGRRILDLSTGNIVRKGTIFGYLDREKLYVLIIIALLV